jgi:hypothetical protein
VRASVVFALAAALLVAYAPIVPAILPPPLFLASESRSLLDLAINPFGARPGPAVMLFLLAALCSALAFTGRARLSWIPALSVVATSGWTWSVLRAHWADTVRYLPGGAEAYPFYAYVKPWPWLLLGPAVMLLGAASWWSVRELRRAKAAAVRKVFE